jgi:hypothetical protein
MDGWVEISEDELMFGLTEDDIYACVIKKDGTTSVFYKFLNYHYDEGLKYGLD